MRSGLRTQYAAAQEFRSAGERPPCDGLTRVATKREAAVRSYDQERFVWPALSRLEVEG